VLPAGFPGECWYRIQLYKLGVGDAVHWGVLWSQCRKKNYFASQFYSSILLIL
jgi:hypothetical protein